MTLTQRASTVRSNTGQTRWCMSAGTATPASAWWSEPSQSGSVHTLTCLTQCVWLSQVQFTLSVTHCQVATPVTAWWSEPLQSGSVHTLTRLTQCVAQSGSVHTLQSERSLCTHTSELRVITCHMWSHSVTCHPTQVNTPRLTPARKADAWFTYPEGMEGRVDLGGWLHIKMAYLPTDSHPTKY